MLACGRLGVVHGRAAALWSHGRLPRPASLLSTPCTFFPRTWKGMWKNSHSLGSSAQARTSRSEGFKRGGSREGGAVQYVAQTEASGITCSHHCNITQQQRPCQTQCPAFTQVALDSVLHTDAQASCTYQARGSNTRGWFTSTDCSVPYDAAEPANPEHDKGHSVTEQHPAPPHPNPPQPSPVK